MGIRVEAITGWKQRMMSNVKAEVEVKVKVKVKADKFTNLNSSNNKNEHFFAPSATLR
jgi:hypothetical protein